MAFKPLENEPGRGVLFHRQADGNKPTLSGGVNIDGVEWEIAGWERTSKNGKSYISLTIKPARKEGDEWPQALRSGGQGGQGGKGRWEP